jgi:putative toxin-antitoxin system toxin component, PIN family
MLDTNVLISMILFPGKNFARMLENITKKHTLVLSSFVVDELVAVIQRKFPNRMDAIDSFLSSLAYELVYTPRKMQGDLFSIRDQNDYPVLYTAIMENVDVLITGDKDFTEVIVEKPEIMTPTEYIAKYIAG